MKRTAVLVSAIMLSASLVAATDSGFGVDAFNRAISAATRGNAVFSPASFEFDCVIFSEAFGAITRAKFAETMGVLNGLESVYQPVYEQLASETGDRGLTFLSARAFCLPDERKANRAYRQWLQNVFSTESFTFDHYKMKGAECWFRARLDGDMEDFSPPENATLLQHYSFFDLVSVSCCLGESTQTNGISALQFNLQDGTVRAIPSVFVTLPVVVWERKNSTAIRIPLADKSWFYVLLPREGLSVRDIRGELCSKFLTDLLAGFRSITDASVHPGIATVDVPLIDITTTSDLKLPFRYFSFPLTGMERLDHEMQPKYVSQRVRFRLNGPRADVPSDTERKDGKEQKAALAVLSDFSPFELNRPFLFFVYHEPTATILVSGQFMGQ